MPDIFAFIRAYYEFYPLVAFISLLLAACNIPISEDLIIITGALLSHGRESNMFHILAALYTGVIAGDFFVYWVGTRVRKGALKIKFFSGSIPQKAMNKMHHYLDKFGIFTFIVCRFIPFGVRNVLFFTSGFFNLRLRIFALYDIVATMISINTLFFIAYYFGEAARRPIKIAGIVLFILVISGMVSLFIRLIILLRKRAKMSINREIITGKETLTGQETSTGQETQTKETHTG